VSKPQDHGIAVREVSQGIPAAIPPANIEAYWYAVEEMLRTMESWTQVLCASDIRAQLADGRMQLWSVLDQNEKAALAITRIGESGRGGVCTVWLLASALSDDASIGALLDSTENLARSRNCMVLEINAVPCWAERVRGKLTNLTFERDLRTPRSVN